jgi:hypothetical protein
MNFKYAEPGAATTAFNGQNDINTTIVATDHAGTTDYPIALSGVRSILDTDDIEAGLEVIINPIYPTGGVGTITIDKTNGSGTIQFKVGRMGSFMLEAGDTDFTITNDDSVNAIVCRVSIYKKA